MIPHAGCILFFPVSLLRESERKIDKRGRGDEILSYEIVFLSPHTMLRNRTRCLSASRISIERPFPVRFHVAKKITRWIRVVSRSRSKESRRGIDYGIKLPLAFAFHAKRSATIGAALWFSSILALTRVFRWHLSNYREAKCPLSLKPDRSKFEMSYV